MKVCSNDMENPFKSIIWNICRIKIVFSALLLYLTFKKFHISVKLIESIMRQDTWL